LLAVLGIFLPSFIFVALLSRFLPAMRKFWWSSSLLDGINAASLGLIAAVAIQLGRSVIVDLFTIILALIALLLLIRYKVSSVWLVLGGGVLGAAYKLIFG
jgi:chromate transporter